MIPCSQYASVHYFLLKTVAVSIFFYFCLGSLCLFSKTGVDKSKTFKSFHQFPFSQAAWSTNRSVAYSFSSVSVDDRNLDKFSTIQIDTNAPKADDLLSSKCMTVTS